MNDSITNRLFYRNLEVVVACVFAVHKLFLYSRSANNFSECTVILLIFYFLFLMCSIM